MLWFSGVTGKVISTSIRVLEYDATAPFDYSNTNLKVRCSCTIGFNLGYESLDPLPKEFKRTSVAIWHVQSVLTCSQVLIINTRCLCRSSVNNEISEGPASPLFVI